MYTKKEKKSYAMSHIDDGTTELLYYNKRDNKLIQVAQLRDDITFISK